MVLPLYPTALTWDALTSIPGSSVAKGARAGLVWDPLHMGFGVYIWLFVERKSQHSMSAGLWLFEIRILSECPRDTSSYPIHQTSHSCWDSPCVWGSRMSMVLVGLNNPRLILLNVKVIQSMVHQIRVWRCGGQGSEESLRELLDSLLCWI